MEFQLTIKYKGTTIRLSADFSSKNSEIGSQGADTFKVLKKQQNNSQARILYPTKSPSNGREKIRLSQINKAEGISSPLDLPSKKFSGQSYRLTQKDTR